MPECLIAFWCRLHCLMWRYKWRESNIGGETWCICNVYSLISSKRIRWPPFFFVLIRSKSIDKIHAVFGLAFYGWFYHKTRFLLTYFPPNVPISWNTNVKITTVTPKLCHIVFMKFNVANAVKSMAIFKETGKKLQK